MHTRIQAVRRGAFVRFDFHAQSFVSSELYKTRRRRCDPGYRFVKDNWTNIFSPLQHEPNEGIH